MKLLALMAYAAEVASVTGCSVSLCPSAMEDGDEVFADLTTKVVALGYSEDEFVSQLEVCCLPGERSDLRCKSVYNKTSQKEFDLEISKEAGTWFLRRAQHGRELGEMLLL